MRWSESWRGAVNELALFAGACGGILGGKLLGWRTVCAVEYDAYAASVLVARQNDGCLEPFPVWDDVRTFDGRRWRGVVDVVSGGFPCQDISAAGKGVGITGERSGLWREMARIIGEVRPRFVWVENSPMLVSRGLGLVLLDLAAMGFAARWGVVGADDAGAPHRRERVWILGYPDSNEIRRDGQWKLAEGEQCGGGRKARSELASFCETLSNAANDGTGRREQQQECGEGTRDVADADEGGRLRRAGADGETEGRGQFTDGGDVPDAAGGGQSMRGRASGEGRHAVRCDLQAEAVSDAVCDGGAAGIPEPEQRQEGFTGEPVNRGSGRACGQGWWKSEPDVGGVADGVAAGVDVHGAAAAGDVGRVAKGVRNRVQRLKCIGNGQVPAAMVLAWFELLESGQGSVVRVQEEEA
jgi:DNA (cytosine-5)-methyltransferase 1